MAHRYELYLYATRLVYSIGFLTWRTINTKAFNPYHLHFPLAFSGAV